MSFELINAQFITSPLMDQENLSVIFQSILASWMRVPNNKTTKNNYKTLLINKNNR